MYIWLINLTRLFLGAIFFTGGVSKLMPFPGVMGPVWLEEVLEPHGLGMYARFIAWSELIIGLLLLSIRYATLGAIMLVPLVINILAITISMNWRGTPYVVGFFLVLNLVLLAHDYPKWSPLVKPPSSTGTWPTWLSVTSCGCVVAGPVAFAVNHLAAYILILLGLLGLFLSAAFGSTPKEPADAR